MLEKLFGPVPEYTNYPDSKALKSAACDNFRILIPADKQVLATMPTVEGTGLPGAAVSVYIDKLPALDTTVESTGRWSVTVPYALSSDDHSVRAVQSYWNRCNAGPVAVKLLGGGGILPLPSVTFPVEGTVVDSDLLVVEGKAIPGNTVKVCIDNLECQQTTASTDGQEPLPPASNDSNCPFEELPDSPSGNFSATVENLTEGSHLLRVSQIDAFGNESKAVCLTIEVKRNQPVLTIDYPAENAQILPGHLHVTGFCADHYVVEANIVESAIQGAAKPHDRRYNIDMVGSLAPESDYLLSVKQYLADGPVVAYRRFSTSAEAEVPAAPVVNSPAVCEVVETLMPIFSGTAEPGNKVLIDLDDKEVMETYADSDGVYRDQFHAELHKGRHVVSVRQQDARTGLISDATVVEFSIGSAAVTVPDPIITYPAEGVQLYDNTPIVSGVAIAGNQIKVCMDDSCSCSFAQVEADGTFSLQLPAPFGLGCHSISAVQVDSFGNASEATAVNFSVLAPQK